ncbi:MAG: hypothetical protein WKG07_07300 [Hymenobacter sp.]
MGRAVGAAVGQRLGRALLELGGNNAIIVTRTGRPGHGHAAPSCLGRWARPGSAAPPRAGSSFAAEHLRRGDQAAAGRLRQAASRPPAASRHPGGPAH